MASREDDRKTSSRDPSGAPRRSRPLDSKKSGAPSRGSARPSAPPKPHRKKRASTDPRSEGRAAVEAERIRLPASLGDPLGMAAGQSQKARMAPEPENPEITTVPPIEDRRTLPFIRATSITSDSPEADSTSMDAGPTDPSQLIPELPTMPGQPLPSLDEFDLPSDPIGGLTDPAPPGASGWPGPSSGWPLEDHAVTDPAPARSSPLPAAGPTPTSSPATRSYHPPSPTPVRPSIPQDGDEVTRPVAIAIELSEKGPTEVGPLIDELLSHGASGLDAVTRQFPGFLWFDKAQSRGRPPRAQHVSAAAATLFRAGRAAIPHIVHLLGASDRNVRFCAALVARELNDPSVVQPLFRMLVDVDPDNVDVAMLAIHHLDKAWVEPRLAQLRASLQNSNASPGQHLMAARTFGALRDVSSVPQLVERVGAKHTDVAEAISAALITLTSHDFKKSRSKWRRWLRRHGGEPRVSWLLDGLLQSDGALRVRAFRELTLLTGEELGVHRTANKAESQALRDEYQAVAVRQGLLRL